MTEYQERHRYGRRAGVLTVEGTEMPDNLNFIAHPTYAGDSFDLAPAILLAPCFTAFTLEEKDNYNPVPYILWGEGFDFIDLGATRLEPVSPPARERGWTVRWDGGEVEVSRPGKTLCRTFLSPWPPVPWKKAVRRAGSVLVMVLEEQVTFASTHDVARAAVVASGSVALLPIL